MRDITVKITFDGGHLYGGTIEIESKKDAERLADDVRKSIAEILTKYYSREKPEAE